MKAVILVAVLLVAIAITVWHRTRRRSVEGIRTEQDLISTPSEPEAAPAGAVDAARTEPNLISGLPPPPAVDPKPVAFTLPDERKAVCEGETILLPRGTALTGMLELRPSDGPLGIRDRDSPFLSAEFVFSWNGREYLYTGLISKWDLWAPNGTRVARDQPEFRDETGQLDGMMDDREDWSYVLPDGSTHTNRLKYTDCWFQVMTQPASLAVKCRYYDQSPDIAGYVTIFYTRPLAEVLLLKDTRIFRDAEGNPEDFSLHDGETITLKRR